jgi:hypothetical protein
MITVMRTYVRCVVSTMPSDQASKATLHVIATQHADHVNAMQG